MCPDRGQLVQSEDDFNTLDVRIVNAVDVARVDRTDVARELM